MKKRDISHIIQLIFNHVFRGVEFAMPATMSFLYIWIVGYNIPSLTPGFIGIIIASFFLGLFLPIENKDTSPSMEILRERLLDKSGDDNSKDDILELMLSNMEEIRDFYSMSKKQAKFSFALSIIFCLIGICILIMSILMFEIIESNKDFTIVSVIVGSISELFATTTFIVHKSAIKQLNVYYQALHDNEQFLSIVNLANQLPSDKRVSAIENIIDKLLTDINLERKVSSDAGTKMENSNKSFNKE